MDGVARAEQAQSTDLASGWRPRGSAFVPCLPKAQEEEAATAAEKPQPLRVVVRKPSLLPNMHAMYGVCSESAHHLFMPPFVTDSLLNIPVWSMLSVPYALGIISVDYL
ncbi:hypothetical protein E2542_SST15554 [Spatholobus suberectus]|nr:hypothetical protein E2542_SST15554 [Spatholobus suberectus]